MKNNSHIMAILLSEVEAETTRKQLEEEAAVANVTRTRQAAEALSKRTDGTGLNLLPFAFAFHWQFPSANSILTEVLRSDTDLHFANCAKRLDGRGFNQLFVKYNNVNTSARQ